LARDYGKPAIVFLNSEETIDGCTASDLSTDGFVIVGSFRELVDAARAILTPETERRRKTLQIPLSTCLLRLWRWDDAESLQRNANNRRVAENLLEQFPHPYTIRDAERWLAGGQSGETVFAIDVDGSAVGAIGFHGRPDCHGGSVRCYKLCLHQQPGPPPALRARFPMECGIDAGP
jgi:hypothetical protein